MSGMSDGMQRDERKCPDCGQERASLKKREEGLASVYYQCLVCQPGWSPPRE
jgi:DNA-directed RNA polymerase subunit M/transcription elongation factor TFIIS